MIVWSNIIVHHDLKQKIMNFFIRHNVQDNIKLNSIVMSQIVNILAGENDNKYIFKLGSDNKENILNLNEIDLICIDAKKESLDNLKSLKDKLNDVKIIQADVVYSEMISKKNLFNEVFEYLFSKNFKFIGNIAEDKNFASCVFVNIEYFNLEDIKKLQNINIDSEIKQSIKKLIASNDIDFYNYLQTPEYDTCIDVVIPTVSKDFKMLGMAVKSIRNNIMHKIDNIFIVAPKGEIEKFCKNENCVFVDENTILPITKSDINYAPCGQSRAGWLFQQLIKLYSDKISNKKYILISDSDTIYTQPQSFIHDDKVQFDCSNEYWDPYFQTYKKLINLDKRVPLSFVAHHMLFDREVLETLRDEIECRCKNIWYNAIINSLDVNENSSFSEYETYANYYYFNNPDKVCFRYWYNTQSSYRIFSKIIKKPKTLKQYKSISVHTYTKNK